MNRVDVIMVTYNSDRYVHSALEALDSAAADPGGDAEVLIRLIVIDNASSDSTAEVVRSVRPDALIVRNVDNVGFARANNQALAGVLAGDHASFAVLVNPDAVLWPGCLWEIIRYMEDHRGVAVAGPALHDRDGTLQPSMRNFPTPWNQLFEAMWLHRLFPRASRRFGEVVVDTEAYREDALVDWVSGAVMALRRAALDEVGCFDERFFLYSEEKDLCKRMVDAGWGVAYVSSAHATHGHDGRGTPESFARQFLSKQLYFEKHHRGLYLFGCKAASWVFWLTRAAAEAAGRATGHSTTDGARARAFGEYRRLRSLTKLERP